MAFGKGDEHPANPLESRFQPHPTALENAQKMLKIRNKNPFHYDI